MRVFISWSGEPSRSIARRSTAGSSDVQYVDAWMSDADHDSGARWNEAIAFHRVQFRFAMEIKGTAADFSDPHPANRPFYGHRLI
jgi:hypothetical protein